MLLAALLPLVCSATFLIHPTPISLGGATPQIDQQSINCPTVMATGQSDGGDSSFKVSFSQVCDKLIKMNQQDVQEQTVSIYTLPRASPERTEHGEGSVALSRGISNGGPFYAMEERMAFTVYINVLPKILLFSARTHGHEPQTLGIKSDLHFNFSHWL